MQEYDLNHPLLCEKECGYNFCESCVEHLIESSQSGAEEASDGHLAVKVKLQCPQCRSDLSHSIRDTLLLRKVDGLKDIMSKNDSELTATEVRVKHSLMVDEDVLKKVKVAQEREDYFKEHHKFEEGSEKRNKPHQIEHFIDVATFRGMEFAMTKEEQEYVSELMISGDVNKLAQAAEILKGIGEMSRKGITPSMRSSTSSQSFEGSIQSISSAPRGNAPRRNMRSGRSGHSGVSRAMAMGYTEEEKQEKRRQADIEAFNKLYPLPVRMPYYVYLDSIFASSNPDPDARLYPIKFLDDEWDGTIADAFSRVMISGVKITKKEVYGKDHPGIKNIVETSESKITPRRNRVVVASIRASVGQLGVQKGDVVTHFDGEMFFGNSDDLRDVIRKKCSIGDGFSLVVNAEPATAQALQTRAQLLKAALGF